MEDLANWSRELGDKIEAEWDATGPSTKGMIKIAETKIAKAEWDVREAKEWTVYGKDD